MLANWGDDWGGCPEEPFERPSNKTTMYTDAATGFFQCENFDRERFVSNFISFARPGTPKDGSKDSLRLELGANDNQVTMVASDHLRVRAMKKLSITNKAGDIDLITVDTATNGGKGILTIRNDGTEVVRIDHAEGTKISDDKISMHSDTSLVATDASGTADAWRLRTNSGTAAGTRASPQTSHYVSGNQVLFQTIDSFTVTDADGVGDAIQVKTSNGVASGNVASANTSLYMSGNQLKITPLDVFQLTDATGIGDAFRVTTANGTANGKVASSNTSTFMSGNEFEIQPLNHYKVTDKTGTMDALKISTSDGVAAGTVASSTTSTYMSGNQFKLQPLNLFQLTDASGNGDAFRVTNANGIAGGTVASSQTSTYMSGNQLKMQPLNQFKVTDRTGNGDGAFHQSSPISSAFSLCLIFSRALKFLPSDRCSNDPH